MKRLKAPEGHVTFTELAKRLIRNTRHKSATLHRYCKELGIELGPVVRHEAYFTKPRVYKGRYRWLTPEEVRRLIEHHHAQRGEWD